MKLSLILIALTVLTLTLKAQSNKLGVAIDSPFTATHINGSNAMSGALIAHSTDFTQTDTVQVIAYCLINPDKLKFKWMKLYGLSGLNNPSINFNGLMVYKTYLMHDRKTPINFKVIYSVNAK